MNRFARMGMAWAAGLLLSGQAMAWNVFPYGDDQALKWGSNTIGTPGGIVTWSLIGDGTGIADGAPDGIHGSSQLGSLFSAIDAAYGSGTSLNALQRAFDSWSAVANVKFVQVSETGSVPLGAGYASVGGSVIGDIRIGAYAVDGFSGAVGYAPKPNGGTTLEGDVVFNIGAAFQAVPAGAAEGSFYDVYLNPSPTDSPDKDGWYHNDLQSLFAHELGHAIGLAHSTEPAALMCGWVDDDFDGSLCNWNPTEQTNWQIPLVRLPTPDDVAGAQYLYGAAPVPEPGSYLLMLAGLGVLLSARRKAGR